MCRVFPNQLDLLVLRAQDGTKMLTSTFELPTDHPGSPTPATGPAGSTSPPWRRLPAGRTHPRRRLHGRGGRGLAGRLAQLAAPHEPMPAASTGAAPTACSCRPGGCRSCARSTSGCARADGVPHPPGPGLVPTRDFYGALAERTFLSTQYVRHHSVPFYTPEPDLVHEIIGHANMLASPTLASLYMEAGRASLAPPAPRPWSSSRGSSGSPSSSASSTRRAI